MPTVAQLTAQIGVEGAETAQSKIMTVSDATTALDRKFSSFVPLNANGMITNQDMAISKLNLLEAQVAKAKDKLATLQNAADAGQSVTGIAEAQSKLDILEGRAQAARISLQELSATSETTGESMQLYGTEVEEAGAKTEVAGKRAEGAKFNLLEFGSKVGMAVMGLQGMVSMAVQAGQALLGPAISAETVTSSLTTMLGSTKAANDEMQRLDTFASQTPFKTLDIDQAAEQMLGFGEKASNVIPEIKAIGDALGSVGKDTPAQLNSVVDIFGKIRTEGHISAMTMNELAVHGINAWKALADGAGKTIPQVKDMVSKGLLPAGDAIKDLTKGIEKNPLYAGGMSRAANTFTGLMSTLLSNFDQLLGKFASPIIKGLEGNLKGLGAALASPAFKDFATNAGKGIVDVFKWIGQGVERVKGPIMQLFGTIGPVLAQMKGPLEQVGAAFKSLFSGKGDSPFAGLHTSMKDIVPLIGATLPSVGMLIDLFKVLSSHSKEIGKWFQTSVLPALHQAAPGFKNLMDALVGLMPIIIDVSTSLHGSFQKALSAMLPVVMAAIPVIIKLAGIVAGGLGKAIRFLAPYVAQAAKAIGEFASEIMVRIAPGLTKFFTNLSKDVDKFMIGWNQAWHYLGPWLKGTWDQLVGIVKIAWAILKGIVLVGIDILSGNWGQAWTDMKQMFQEIWDGMKDWFKGTIELFIATLRPLLDALSHIPGPVGDMAKKVLSSFDSMSKGADKHTLLMKAVMLNRTAEMHTIAAAHLAKMKDDLIAKMKATSDETQKHALNMKIKTVSHLEDMQKQAAAKAKLMAKGVTDHAQGMSDDMVGHSIIPDMVKSIVSYFTALPGQAMSAVSGFAGQIGNFFTGLANDALTWGSKIVSNLISGIQSMAGNVAKAASDIAQQIADHFPHSPAKIGPLRNIPLWGPALVRMFSEDLRKHTPKARAAAEHMAKQLREAITITDANNPIHWGTGGKHTHRTGGGSGTSGNSSFAGSGTSAGGGYQFTSSMPNAPHLHVHPPAITLDGHLLTKHTMPHHVRHIREHTGHHH